MKPHRIQLKRTKGWRMPENTVKVDRSTPYGNPFNATQSYVAFTQDGFPMPLLPLRTEPSLDRCLDMFSAYIWTRLQLRPAFLDQLRGKNLACWCPLDQPCHADVLLELANAPT